MVGDTSLSFRDHRRIGREDDTDLRALGGHKLDRILVYLGGGDDFGRARVPRIGLGTLYRRVEAGVEVLNGVFSATVNDPFNTPTNSTITVGPPELKVFRAGVFIMDGAITIVCADPSSISVAPDNLLVCLAVQDDRTLSGANRAALKASTCPPSARNIRLVLVGLRNLSDLTGQLCLVGRTLTDDRPIIESERKTSVPDERCLALVRNGRDSERLADFELIDSPGATDADLG